MISGFLDAPGTVRELALVHRTAVSLAVSIWRIFLLSSGRTGWMLRQRTDHSRIVYVLPDDFPQRLMRFREVSRMPWAEIARRLGADPRPSGGGTRTASGPMPTISWPYRTSQRAGASATCSPSERRHTRQRSLRAEGSPGKTPEFAPPEAYRTPGGLDIPVGEGLRLPHGRTSDAMPRGRAHHSIGEAAMSPGRCKASSHTCTRGGPSSRRPVKPSGPPHSNLERVTSGQFCL